MVPACMPVSLKCPPVASRPTIGTHDGRFHLDEILACAMLLSLPEFSNAKILRTRDPALHEKCEILVDVGGVHDAETKRFDHHQRGFTTTFDFAKYEAAPPESLLEPCQLENPPRLREAVTKLSSAGLVYVHFGIRLLRERFGIEDEGSLRAMMLEVYTQFVEAVDAHDNGVGISRGGPPMYVDKTSLPHRIAALFPFGGEDAAKQRQQQTVAAWEMQQALAAEACAETHAPQYAAAKEALGRGCVSPFNWLHVPIYGGEPLDVWAFRKGLKLADEAFAAAVSFLRDSWLPGRPVLKQALTEGAAGILKTHVVELPKWSPTEGHIYALERELGLSTPLKFQVYPSERSGPDASTYTAWTVRCIPVEGEPFVSRLPLRQSWRGLRDQALGKAVLAGTPETRRAELQLTPKDFVFCHATGFLGIALSRNAAYEMMRQTLEEAGAENLQGTTEESQ
ncbi:UPF0160 protein MYG1, mitochondrial [Cyclospora cayetanensis]|uniref:UPF0160 protein MYG1, mitochondrial n=1 Tax=Cyclospora cayetanensis TaxID=88456 RepID=A0A6P6RZZ2_9EIME|nr:UPF0160 protein MYG1, mitochondrial [Cyclospora cayetanensis]